MFIHVICVHIYLLDIAVVSLHLVAIFIFSHLSQLLCNFVSETKCLSYVCIYVRCIGALQ